MKWLVIGLILVLAFIAGGIYEEQLRIGECPHTTTKKLHRAFPPAEIKYKVCVPPTNKQIVGEDEKSR